MLSQKDLLKRVIDLIEEKTANKQRASAGWLTTTIIGSFSQIDGDEEGEWLLCAYGHVRDTVGEACRRYDGRPDQDDRQLVIPGCTRLQTKYLVGNGDVVPIECMTDEEIDAKVAQLESYAHGALQHADELKQFKASRQRPEAPPVH